MLPLLSVLLLGSVPLSSPTPPLRHASTPPFNWPLPPFPHAITAQIILNGQPLPIPWKHWQEGGRRRIAISDLGLVSGFGMELLDTSNPNLQPIQWYSEGDRVREGLPVVRSATIRYVDITDLAERWGWQMMVQQNGLVIETGTSQMVGIRQEKQPWGDTPAESRGDRLVIELDRETPARLTYSPGKAVIFLEAIASPQLLNAFHSTRGNTITEVKFRSQQQRTQVEITLANNTIRPQLVTLKAPYRVVIDLHADASIPTKRIQWAPGIQWRQQTLTLGSSQFPVFWLEIDPQNPQINLRPLRSNPQGAPGISPLITLATQSQVAAAINAGFFNRNNQLPLGVIRQDGEWISGPILNRGAIAWNDQGQFLIDRLTLTETLITETGQQFPILHLNSGYVKAGLSRYTSAWGATYTPLTDNELMITVQGVRASDSVEYRVLSQTQGTKAGVGPTTIPDPGYLLVYRGQPSPAFLSPGSHLQIQTTSFPALASTYPFTLGAGPLLIKNGRIVLNAEAEGFSAAFIREQASRSAIGLTPDGKLILVAVHHRAYGKGPTLAEMAQIMQQLGTVDALNLDGGSSTGLYLGGQLLDRSPQSAARLHNALGIFLQP